MNDLISQIVGWSVVTITTSIFLVVTAMEIKDVVKGLLSKTVLNNEKK